MVCKRVTIFTDFPGMEEAYEKLVLSGSHCTVVNDEQSTQRILLRVEAGCVCVCVHKMFWTMCVFMFDKHCMLV